MRCPSCDLENPPTAERCDCGHALTEKAAEKSREAGSVLVLFSIDDSLKRIHRLLWWIVVGGPLLAFVVWVVWIIIGVVETGSGK